MEAINSAAMQPEIFRQRPDFFYSTIVWDGDRPADIFRSQGWPVATTSKTFYNLSRGHRYDDLRYEGWVQFGLWVQRPIQRVGEVLRGQRLVIGPLQLRAQIKTPALRTIGDFDPLRSGRHRLAVHVDSSEAFVQIAQNLMGRQPLRTVRIEAVRLRTIAPLQHRLGSACHAPAEQQIDGESTLERHGADHRS